MSYPVLNQVNKSLRISEISGGIVIDAKENEIPDNKSPDMLNMIFDGRVLKKREGQRVLFDLGGGEIISCYDRVFYNFIIYHVEDEIVCFSLEENIRQTLKRRVEKMRGKFFSYNGFVYYIGTGEYYKIAYDKENNQLICSVVTGYIPNVLINCDSSGVGDSNEAYNLLTAGFNVTYNVTGNMNEIQIPNAPLDSNFPVVIKVNNTEIDSSEYTVNYNTGRVEFNISLPAGHNNLSVMAYSGNEDVKKDREKITFCNAYECFGGSSSGLFDGTRIFVAGNREYANTFFRSALKNPEYFPIDQFDILGDAIDPIVGFGKQYSSLIIFKEKSIYLSHYVYTNDEPVFTISQIHPSIGCDVANSILTVNNQLVFINSNYGVLSLYSTNIKEEKNVRVISNNINGIYSKKGLLNQPDLKDAVCFIYKERYYIATGSYCYVLNFKYNFHRNMKDENFSWYLFDNIKANCCFASEDKIYLGGGGERFCYFTNDLYDFDIDTPINAYFKTKAFDFGNPSYFKRIFDVCLMLRADNNSYLKIKFTDEDGPFKKIYEYFLNRFSFLNFSFSKFTFYDNQYAVLIKRKVHRKRVKFFSITLENKINNSDMAVSDITINYNLERGAKYNGC